MKARFWTFAHTTAPVRLTLRPGQILRHSSRWHNGEGWSWYAEEYENSPLEGGIIHRWSSGGRDCDGLHRDGGERFAFYADLASCLMHEQPGLLQPLWQDAAAGFTHDQFAELANY